jgi:HEAT repeat protein
MPAPVLLLLVAAALLPPAEGGPARADLPRLRELLRDRQCPRGQSQAALLLLQSEGPEAEQMVRQALRQADDLDTFLALASAVRLAQDGRFLDELIAALTNNRPGVRQAAAEALAVLADPQLVPRLQAVVEDERAEPVVRQAALWALGRCGRKKAAAVLLEQLGGADEVLRRTASDALTDLSGRPYGLDAAAWRLWWERCKDLPAERWLEQRLAYQADRARRLEGDLERARAQVLRLHQQLYARLPLADRLGYIQALVDHDTPAVRTMAVVWAVELMAAPDASRQQAIGQVLLKLSHDGTAEVQRAASLGLGRVGDAAALDRLLTLVQDGPPPVRAAAARALAALARGAGPDAQARQKQVVPALQKALDDPSLDVVVEAAEELGSLGALEAGPVLTGLLKHPSEAVRQTAAQALERVADASVFDGLLAGLDDPSGPVRFSLLGAAARAAAGPGLKDAQRRKLGDKLEGLLLKDADPGVRSRAATVLGEVGTPAVLPVLWRCVLAGEDARVQEKAWAAFVEVLARSGDVEQLQEWDRVLGLARPQAARRLHLLAEVAARWQRRPDWQAKAWAAQEALVQAQLEQGRWSAAAPQVREMLGRPGGEAETERRLRWLLAVGELALKDGQRAEAQRAVQDALPLLPRSGPLSDAFGRLARDAGVPRD